MPEALTTPLPPTRPDLLALSDGWSLPTTIAVGSPAVGNPVTSPTPAAARLDPMDLELIRSRLAQHIDALGHAAASIQRVAAATRWESPARAAMEDHLAAVLGWLHRAAARYQDIAAGLGR